MTSRWSAVVQPDGSVALEGTLTARVHYWEEGNVQLKATHRVNALLPSQARLIHRTTYIVHCTSYIHETSPQRLRDVQNAG